MNLQHAFFEKTVKKYPNYIAVDDHGKKITYLKLDQEANKLANFIRKLNIKPNNRVCILLNKNIYQYISILGILKSGSCWVPLSKNFPKDRLSNLIQKIQPSLIITDQESLKKNSKIFKNIYTLVIDSEIKKKNVFSRLNLKKESIIKPTNINTSLDLAYIIFTSGSTGIPKGVMVSHQNISEYLINKSAYFKPSKKLRFAHISEITFDPSIFDLFVCWLNAGTVVPFNKNSYRINPSKFFKTNKNINVIFTLPSFVNLVLENFDKKSLSNLKNIKYIFLTGEPANNIIVNKVYKFIKNVKVFNVYGTTETCIISNYFYINKKALKNKSISIGSVLPNLKYLLIDENGEINEKKGEICFAGEQISRGYWDNDYLNKKYFVDLSSDGKFFTKFYKTGDIVRKEDGKLYLDGRTDNQIKIKGYRLELEEIENSLNSLDVIENSVVLIFPNNENEDKKLFFFIQVEINKDLKKTKTIVENYIKNNFPFYMLPSNIFFLRKDFPRNINNKVDKKKLIKDYVNNA